MKGDALPPSDHVLRYVRPGLIDGDRLNGSAFLPRPGEAGVSCNWWEYHELPENARLSAIRAVSRLTYSKSGCLAMANVGRCTGALLAQEIAGIQFVHDPLDAKPGHTDPRHMVSDPSHALITGMGHVDDPAGEMAGDILARQVVMRFPAIAG